MASLLVSRRDVDFLLFEWLDVTRLTERPAFAEHSRQTFDAALAAVDVRASRTGGPHPIRCCGRIVWLSPHTETAFHLHYSLCWPALDGV
jgi:hypothetical protein